MKVHYILLAVIALMMSSCSTFKHTATVAPVEPTVVSMVVADMDVQNSKISKTTSWNWNPFKRVNINTLKENTTAQMLIEAGADVLVEPEYIIEQRGLWRGGSITVIGFPAKFTDFHKMTPAEAKMFDACYGTDETECDKNTKTCFDTRSKKFVKYVK